MDTRAKNRPKRIPVGGPRNILTVDGKDPNFKYSWVNDRDGMIERFKAGGYEVVTHKVEVGDPTADTGKGTSSAVSRDVGHGTTAYLMRIRKDWHEEDMAAKHARIDASEEDMKRTLNSGTNGQYGKVEIK